MFWKSVGLLGGGLLTAAVVYPLLHETGHAVMAVLAGAVVAEFHLFPLPFVVCEVTGVDAVGQLCISVGGIAFPCLLSAVCRPRNFWLWYVNLLVKGIGLYAVLLSAVAVVCHMSGNRWPNEDILHVLSVFPNSGGIVLTVLILTGFGLWRSLVNEHPLLRCEMYFEPSS